MEEFPLNQRWKKILPNSVLYWIIMVEENLKILSGLHLPHVLLNYIRSRKGSRTTSMS